MLAGINAPRIVVRPPNVPAPPPISLLTQGNVVSDDSDVVQPDGQWRWEGGGGTFWMEPIRQPSMLGVWQNWPTHSGAASTNKRGEGLTDAAGPAKQSPTQYPFMQTAVLEQGVLTAFSLANAVEGDVAGQVQRAMDALAARTIERELWTSGVVDGAQWDSQFRLKRKSGVTTVTNANQPYVRALALAENAAADAGFLDGYGGAFIHCSVALFSLLAARSQNLVRSPSGRQWMTPSGCVLVPEPGATGKWNETGDAWIEEKPGGAGANDNIANGWLFVTPPVRVRLGSTSFQEYESNINFTNDTTIVAERAVVIEASVTPNTLAIPVDYTQET